MTSPTNELAEAVKAIPPVTVTTAAFMGIPFQQWVYVLTAFYTLFQIFRLFPKIYGCIVCFRKHGTCKRTCKG